MLDKNSCEPCRGGIPPLSESEAEALLTETPKWSLIDNSTKIKRNFAFDNFVDALAFVNKLGELCESEGHHADISFGWGYCEVTFYSHKIGGLHKNDFIMAAKLNTLYQS